MPKVNVHIAPAGNPLNNGRPSLTGHMWFTLDDGNGHVDTYGFSPKMPGEPHGDGEVKIDDDQHYINPPYNYEKAITQEQYERIRDFAENARLSSESNKGRWAEYNGLFNSCVDFTYSALNAGGLLDSPEGGFQGNVFPWFNRWDIERELTGENWWTRNLDKRLNDLYLRFRNARPQRDPLALDLDGDGIETIGISGDNPILFDHDGDGIKTGTGWLKGDDAFLVLDRNGNGRIDTGSELFGVDTLLANGQHATDGFSALADQDSNHDGVFDQQDANFAQVRLWQDRNQDGISQTDELISLDAAGIARISLSNQSSNTDLGNGNTLISTGSFTRSDGSTGTTGEFSTQGSASLNLASNPFYREFPAIPVADAVRDLPNLKGSGALRDMQEAATLSPEFASLLQTYQTQARTGYDAMRAGVDGVIDGWVGKKKGRLNSACFGNSANGELWRMVG